MRLATIQAELAPHIKWRVGSVIVRGGSVVGRGFNRYRNDPSNVHYHGVSYHAEASALRRAGDNSAGSTLYVARLTMGGDLGLSRPCSRCQLLLSQHHVHTVVWTSPRGLHKARVSQLCNTHEEPHDELEPILN